VVDEWGVEVVEGDVPVGVKESAVKEVKDGQNYQCTGEGGTVDGGQGPKFFEDAFPKGVREVSVREDGVSGVDAEVRTERDRAKPVDPG